MKTRLHWYCVSRSRAWLPVLVMISCGFWSGAGAASPVPDPRHISNGWIIPSAGYADQPYLVKTDDGAWLGVMTTGKGVEGASGQHVVSMRSTDKGRTWEQIVALEPADGPAASYAVLLQVPSGRIYAFYNHNTDRVPEVQREDGGKFYVTETQKTLGRVHEIPGALLDGLFDHFDNQRVATNGLVLSLRAPNGAPTLQIAKAVQALRLYHRALRTSEAVGNFRAGLLR